MSALRIDSVTKTYPPAVHALRGVSIRIDRGEFVGIVGRSGSGKSTLLHIMGTLDTPTTGSVEIGGADTRGLSDATLTALRAETLGFVFQGFHLDDTMTALQNVSSGLMYAGVRRRDRGRRAAEALDRVGLADRMAHRPQQLSGGERQRVAIARAIAKEPTLVLADEPTGALDTANREQVLDLLARLNADGTTIAVITHDLEVASRMPRRIVLQDGRILSDTAGAA